MSFGLTKEHQISSQEQVLWACCMGGGNLFIIDVNIFLVENIFRSSG